MATRLVTKSIRLTEEEAGAVQELVGHTGEVEAAVLKRAMLRGLQELRTENAILAYLRDRDSASAAEIAGLPRARFLDILIERGISLLTGPSTVLDEVADLAEAISPGSIAVKSNDVRAWEDELRFIRKRCQLPHGGASRNWSREELYEDRIRSTSR